MKSSKIQWKKRRRRRGRRRLLKSLDVVPAATENTSQAGPTQPVAHVPIGTEVLLAIDIFQGDAAGFRFRFRLVISRKQRAQKLS